MSREIPSYRRASNGQAFVQHKSIPTKNHRMYLGVYGSPESRRKYQRFLAKLAESRETPTLKASVCAPSIAVLIREYELHAKEYYSVDGVPTKEFAGMKMALKHLVGLHGEVPADDYGPKLLKELQKHLISGGYCRNEVNKRIARVKRFFRWCSQEERVKPEIYHGLLCLSPSKKGRGGVRESDPVTPVAWAWAEATLPHVSPQVAAMIQVQYFCGMRPEEVCAMRPCDIDMTGEIWIYRPQEHKNSWRGHSLSKAIPKVAQRVIRPYLTRATDAYLFSPREAEEWRIANRPRIKPRKCPVYPSELQAREKRRAERKRKSRLREHYDTASYRRAIVYGFKRAAANKVEIPHWCPLQLRHSVATLVENTLGRQAASRWLGHARLDTTGIYVEVQVAELIAVAKALDERWAG